MKKFIGVLLLMLINLTMYAQSVDEVTLVVSGEGVTKTDATNAALRSAIEQAYGVFVSSNTEILNDELVKDEIATISSGNIKSYKELSYGQSPNGLSYITLNATVSIKKLISYSQSKGSECEFAGATFGANTQLLNLNIKNTKIAFENMMKQIKELSPYMYDFEVEADASNFNGYGNMRNDNRDSEITNCNIKINVKIIPNNTAELVKNIIISTLNGLNIPEETNLNGFYPYELFLDEWYFPNTINKAKEITQNYNGKKHTYVVVADRMGALNTITEYKLYSPFPIDELCYCISKNALSFDVSDNLGNLYEFNETIGIKDLCYDYGYLFRNTPNCLRYISFVDDKEIKKIEKKAETNKNKELLFGKKDGYAVLDKTKVYYGSIPGDCLYTLEKIFSIPVSTISSITKFEIKVKCDENGNTGGSVK